MGGRWVGPIQVLLWLGVSTPKEALKLLAEAKNNQQTRGARGMQAHVRD